VASGNGKTTPAINGDPNLSNEASGKDQPWKRLVEIQSPYSAADANDMKEAPVKKGAIRLTNDFLDATLSG